MFGYDPITFFAALVALGALVIGLTLLMQKNLLGMIGPLFVGAAAWQVGGLSTGDFTGVASTVVGGLLALLTSVVAAATGGLGVDLPVVPIVLVLLAAFLLTRRNGKKK